MQLEALHWFPSSSPPQFYGSLDLLSFPKLSSKARQIWFHINCSQFLHIKGDSHSYDLWVTSSHRLKRNVVFKTPERLRCLEIFFRRGGMFFQSLTSFPACPFFLFPEKKVQWQFCGCTSELYEASCTSKWSLHLSLPKKRTHFLSVYRILI